jgi:hypothetical protein
VCGAVSLVRPHGAKVLRELAGDLPGAASEAVFGALAERLDDGASAFMADPATARLVVQGGYWYRGEYAVEPTAGGSRVRLTIVNVAPGWKPLGALTGRSVLRASPSAFDDLLADVARAVQRAT